jgi:two-component system alkaline phosphatase synthesis response regulator PhoP
MPRILVVEDETDLGALMAHHLESAGHSVRVAVDGRRALELVRSFQPELVLVDVMLPDIVGYGLCEILRSDARTASLPLVIVSALHDAEAVRLGLEAGADDYISKPFSPAKLVSRVELWLRRDRPARLPVPPRSSIRR